MDVMIAKDLDMADGVMLPGPGRNYTGVVIHECHYHRNVLGVVYLSMFYLLVDRLI